MKKNSWLGYLGSALILFAGILMIAAKKRTTGILLIVTSVVGLILKIKLDQSNKK